VHAQLLGTAGWVPTDSRETACVAVRNGEQLLLLDAGTGVRRLLTSPEVVDGVRRIDILLSHFHVDHVVGLSYLPGLAAGTECVVWGPGRAMYATPTAELLRRFIGPPLFALDVDDFLSVQELRVGELSFGPLTLSIRLQEKHTHPSVAFRIGDDLTYCTDTGYDAENSSFAAGCRHLIHEAFYVDNPPDATHATPEEAGRIAADAEVARLILVHLPPRLDDEARVLARARAHFPKTEIGRDVAVLT
jgi:ribonuclease BN (tRNA processing enzyme)